jgi:poly(3-hydroxybutyrate) depolymerase
MALRLACESSRFAAGVSLAGPVDDAFEGRCARGKGQASVLLIHGTRDGVVPLAGGPVSVAPPGTPPTLGAWGTLHVFSRKLGCQGDPTRGPDLDLEDARPGLETQSLGWSNCAQGAETRLFQVEGMGHAPYRTTQTWGRVLWGFLRNHVRKP